MKILTNTLANYALHPKAKTGTLPHMQVKTLGLAWLVVSQLATAHALSVPDTHLKPHQLGNDTYYKITAAAADQLCNDYFKGRAIYDWFFWRRYCVEDLTGTIIEEHSLTLAQNMARAGYRRATMKFLSAVLNQQIDGKALRYMLTEVVKYPLNRTHAHLVAFAMRDRNYDIEFLKMCRDDRGWINSLNPLGDDQKMIHVLHCLRLLGDYELIDQAERKLFVGCNGELSQDLMILSHIEDRLLCMEETAAEISLAREDQIRHDQLIVRLKRDASELTHGLKNSATQAASAAYEWSQDVRGYLWQWLSGESQEP